MANSWLRLWHELPNDPKWRTIARISGRSIAEVVTVYLHILVDASTATERGRTQPNAEDIASALDVTSEAIIAILSAMDGRVIENGLVLGWDKRQPQREDNSADRAKRWREENKRTQPNATERNRTLDKDKDTDKETTKTLAPSATALVARSSAPVKARDLSESPNTADSSSLALPPAGTLPLVDKTNWTFTQKDVDGWSEAYPAVNVMGELRQMKEWFVANPTKKKTRNGIRRAIVHWLAGEQDKAGRTGGFHHDRTTATQRSLAAAGQYLETLRNSQDIDAPEHSAAGGSITGNLRRIC